jgi:hypothetical protein
MAVLPVPRWSTELSVPLIAALFPSPIASTLFPVFVVNETSATPGTLSRCTKTPCATCHRTIIATTAKPAAHNQTGDLLLLPVREAELLGFFPAMIATPPVDKQAIRRERPQPPRHDVRNLGNFTV